MLAFLTRRKETPMPDTDTTTEASTAWPEHVVARYLTLANGTVDLTHETESDKTYTWATCTGCTKRTAHSWANWYRGAHGIVNFQDQSKGDQEARDWAQDHAEKCRALPNPAA
jgi:hypothetical protein